MRALLILLAGVVIGALVAFSAANALYQRNAWPRGVMNVLQHHVGELRRLQRRNDCAPEKSAAHFQRLAQTGADIGPAFTDEKPDFHDQARRFVDASNRLGAEAPANCQALDQALQQTSDACESCHRQYR
jgi:hypothetical protein